MSMKLIFAIARDKDANSAVEAMNRVHIGVTRLHSTGGFLRDGNTTLMIGVETERVEEVLSILKANCARRNELEIVTPHGTGGAPSWRLGYTPIPVEVGGATVFVLDVDQFHKF